MELGIHCFETLLDLMLSNLLLYLYHGEVDVAHLLLLLEAILNDLPESQEQVFDIHQNHYVESIFVAGFGFLNF